MRHAIVLAALLAIAGAAYSQTTARRADPAADLAKTICDTKTNDAVRALAASQLAKLGPAACAQLVDVVAQGLDRPEGAKAWQTLAQMGPVGVDAINLRWDSLSDTARFNLLETRAKHDPKGAAQFARQAYTHDDVDHRMLAVMFFARHPDSAVKADFLAGLKAQPPKVRWQLVAALAVLGGDDVVAELLPLLKKGSWIAKGEGQPTPLDRVEYWWPDGRYHLVGALAQLKAASAAPALLELLQEEGAGNNYLGELIVPVLVAWNYQPVVPELRRIRDTTRPKIGTKPPQRKDNPWVEPRDFRRITLEAELALFRLGDRSSDPSLLGTLREYLKKDHDDQYHWRGRIAETVAQYGVYDHIPWLIEMLDDNHMRTYAARGLQRLTGLAKFDGYDFQQWWPKHQQEFEKAR